MELNIVGEQDVGALVGDSRVIPEASTIDDPSFVECIQETMYAVEFDAPLTGGGELRFRIPMMFKISKEIF